MKLLAKIFDWVFDPGYIHTQAYVDDYLSRAVDMTDLERRMRVLDERRPFGPFGMNA